jgi:site-specific DNA-methyltransferase (adenine-specific)
MGEWLDRLLAVFAQVRRVLRSDGCMWVEIGDAHAGKVPGNHRPDHTHGRFTGTRGGQAASKASRMLARRRFEGVKLKDLLCLPFELALALRAQGWWLRQTIIWEKPTCTPETVRDRPSTSHSYVFLLSKSMRYAYDRDAISERTTGGAHPRGSGKGGKGSTLALPMSHRGVPKQNASFSSAVTALVDRRNKRSVWRIQSEPSAWKHCAAFPRKLVEPCVLAGCPAGGRVLDPFSGSGTVGVVCRALRRDFTGIELNAETAAFSENRIRHVTAGLPIGVSA